MLAGISFLRPSTVETLSLLRLEKQPTCLLLMPLKRTTCDFFRGIAGIIYIPSDSSDATGEEPELISSVYSQREKKQTADGEAEEEDSQCITLFNTQANDLSFLILDFKH